MRGKLLIQLLLAMAVVATGCTSKSGTIIDNYNSFKFDKKVIEKLPLYDSLATVISQHISLFQRNTGESDDFHGFRYRTDDKEKEFHQLPAAAAPAINRQIALLGKDLIEGFDVFRDSSIKIHIRYMVNNSVETEESLSFFPPGKKMNRREPPVKDTVLNDRWLYWARFNKQGLF